MKYVCELCGRIYDEAIGDAKRGIAAGTAFSSLPTEYECPDCGSGKEAFIQASSGESVATPGNQDYCSQR